MFRLEIDLSDLSSMGLGERCLGCTDCTGLCREVVDMTVLPDILLDRDDKAGGGRRSGAV